MILEGLGLGKNCYYLDPDAKNSTFFNYLEYLNKKRVKSFEQLEVLVRKFAANNELILNENNENISLTHKNASQNLYKLLSKYNNENKNSE